MLAGARSRYAFCRTFRYLTGETALMIREPIYFRDDPRNRYHTVVRGDTPWTLAERFFPNISNPAGLWWLINDYQDPPIDDPTVQLVPGSTVVIPPPEILIEVFSARRADDVSVF